MAASYRTGKCNVNGGSSATEARFVSKEGPVVFRGLRHVVSAHTIETVRPALAGIESAVREGLHAAGFVAYEAAPAFDSAFAAHPPTDFPLLWFGLYETKEIAGPCEAPAGAIEVGPWRPLVDERQYRAAIDDIRERIAAGETYQVNYTFPFETEFRGDPEAWFERLCAAQGGLHSAFIRAGRWCVLSASPELFFRLDGGRLETRPMKGTRPRGRWTEEDRRLAAELAASDKDRAENVMIVDLLRNDMGRISLPGSVEVERLFEVERYETVWQMTSSIVSRTSAAVPEIFGALFPSGSVTGAPKVQTMSIIRALEPFPRGVYCGAIGWWSPDRRAEFNVAIRTVTADLETGVARYPVGGGITWGSTPSDEFEECRVKAVLITRERPAFDLLESLRFEENSYFLLNEHLARLRDSAAYFGFDLDFNRVEAVLAAQAAALTGRVGAFKVRLRAARDGSVCTEAAPLAVPRRFRVAFAAEPVDERDPFLFHKTTNRRLYENAVATRPDCDDVLLWNRGGEVTESTIANVVIERAGDRWTPPIECGLLAGAMRARLLADGRLREAVLTRDDVRAADRLWLINSVRTWIETEWTDAEIAPP
jgi:para-aminobenzoate synthetase/4-amino-4-deoxychorismate lyase